ncbi:hypothetical protein MmTuc01_3128 [Methanosarcina mazei Tuc01]|uniref:Squalene cyclase C-terminal domain-containing protein n=1 Tax=Methanosarcina mazei Tuc01 TaxID=1236903 RepID=M1QDR7_METMZ|nr:hypothetical protein MmTuc01_3128 [Methanosarcina mazei Tuc01]
MISETIQKGILPNQKVEGNLAYTVDPVYGIIRNRVNAECVKTLIRINGLRGSEYTDHIEKLLNWLLDKQNSDGSWNEVHVNYNHPSALITSIVGEALVDGYLLLKNERLKMAAFQARENSLPLIMAGLTMNSKRGTIEPDNNFPDLFMTSEVLQNLELWILQTNL